MKYLSLVDQEAIETIFTIEEMTCSHCAGKIHRALESGMPVGTVFSVDLEEQRVTVTGDAALAEALIRDAGYTPRRLRR